MYKFNFAPRVNNSPALIQTKEILHYKHTILKGENFTGRVRYIASHILSNNFKLVSRYCSEMSLLNIQHGWVYFYIAKVLLCSRNII